MKVLPRKEFKRLVYKLVHSVCEMGGLACQLVPLAYLLHWLPPLTEPTFAQAISRSGSIFH